MNMSETLRPIMRKPAPLLLSLAAVLLAGCASRAAMTIPASDGEPRPAATVDPDSRTSPSGTPNLGDPANREATINAGGPDASSPGGPHPQPASTAGGTGDTRGLVRSGSPD